MRKNQLILKSLFILLLVVGAILTSSTYSFGQFLEDYGNIGTLKTFKGQVRDAAEGLVPVATVQFRNINSEEFQTFEADENGIFSVKGLPSGEYKVRVEMSGFNITEFTVKVSPRSSTASRKFVIIRLSPGCASGGSVELESKIKKE
ncbi:MAG: carboxypeptidase-like regulatory domain-containing protein [Actinomycetota bacterium]